MAESQNIEYKESWRDEYLKWICGFANAQGGTIFIGVRDDGSIVGVKNAKKLLEDIPNKIRDGMGIIVAVNQLEKNGLPYIEIDVPAHPIGILSVFPTSAYVSIGLLSASRTNVFFKRGSA